MRGMHARTLSGGHSRQGFAPRQDVFKRNLSVLLFDGCFVDLAYKSRILEDYDS